jgi:proteic killer suppression protein
MIGSFRNKALRDFWRTGRSAKIDSRLQGRIKERLDALDAVERPEDMDIPGYDFHALKGFRPKRYTVHVNGPLCLTFEFEDGEALHVDLENYH